MKEFQCGALVPGCQWAARHEMEAEVIRRAAKHLHDVHGKPIYDATIEAIRSRIETLRDAA